MKWIYCFILITAFWSCRGVKYVPVESVRVDSIYILKMQRDSIYERDSIHIREKGDTVFAEKYRYKYIYKLIRDTMYVARIDSVEVPYPVEKELNKWQRMKMELGGWAFGIIVAGVLIITGWMVYKKRKKQ